MDKIEYATFSYDKPVFHFNGTIAKRSVFYWVHISSTWVFRKQKNTLRFATMRLKWKTACTVEVKNEVNFKIVLVYEFWQLYDFLHSN